MYKVLKVALLIGTLVLGFGLLFVRASSGSLGDMFPVLLLVGIVGIIVLFALGITFAMGVKNSVKTPKIPGQQMSGSRLFGNMLALFFFPAILLWISAWESTDDRLRPISFAVTGLACIVAVYMIAKNLKRS